MYRSIKTQQARAETPALPGIVSDPVRREMRHADNLGVVTVDGTRYLAGPEYRNLAVRARLRAFDVEIRSMDGMGIAGLERAYGRNTVTASDPASIPPIVARKSPRSWSESPLRGDFPETVRDALDAMEDRGRGQLLRDITAPSQANGAAVTVQAYRAVLKSGRELTPTGTDLSRYERFMKETRS